MKEMINNSILKNYISFKLDKDINDITKEDLINIEDIFLDYEETSSFNYDELLIFFNLKELTLRNFPIDNSVYYIFLSLPKLKSITFDNCSFINPNINAALDIEELFLINCHIENYNFIYIMDKLKRLSIINGKVELNKLNKLNNLEYLRISNSNVKDFNHNIMLNKLNTLYIDNTNIKDLNIISNLNNLNVLGIDSIQYNENKKLLESENITIVDPAGDILKERVGDK